jgi:GDSL-like Lipase/Acylhydrolase family
MPVLDRPVAVDPAVLADPARGWRRMIRVDASTGGVSDWVHSAEALRPEKLVYAEGDSWFKRFGTFGKRGSNLIDAIRTPFHAVVIDAARAGEEVRSMVIGSQAKQTRALFNQMDFDAVLLSAGGNDLKNIFAALFEAKAQMREGAIAMFPRAGVDKLASPADWSDPFDETLDNIGRFIDLRNGATRESTRHAPIFLHGYDYLQPRPAGAELFHHSPIGAGPWLFPSLAAAGLEEQQMWMFTKQVVDQLNRRLALVLAPLPNVHVIDQRGQLMPASATSAGNSNDWLDEIHPNEQGFTRLARQCWDVPLSRGLGWVPGLCDLA